MANQNDSFIDEVTEDLRRDRLFGVFRRYGWIAIALIVLVVAGAALALFVLLPLLRPGSLLRYSREIERRDPGLEGALLSLVEFSRPGPELENRCSRELLESLAADTARRCPQIKIDKLLPARAASRALLLAGLACILPLGATLLDPEGMLQLGRRLVNPSAELPRPTSVFLLVEVDRAVVGRGKEVSIKVSVDRGKPGELVLLSRESRAPGNDSWKSTHLLSTAGGEPGTILHKVRALSSFDFRVRGGDYLSPVKHVEVREPPAPRNFTITYHYPEYTARRERTVEKNSGNISALKGSRAEILLEAEVESVRFPGEDGALGVLAHHTTMVALTESGLLRARTPQGENLEFVVHSGFAEMRDNVLTVLPQAAENVESIDLDRARKAAERAQERLRSSEGNLDLVRARAALRRALLAHADPDVGVNDVGIGHGFTRFGGEGKSVGQTVLLDHRTMRHGLAPRQRRKERFRAPMRYEQERFRRSVAAEKNGAAGTGKVAPLCAARIRFAIKEGFFRRFPDERNYARCELSGKDGFLIRKEIGDVSADPWID